MYAFLMTIHVIACFLLIILVLLQAGRGAGLAIFGGGGDTLFASPSGSSALKRATVVLASTFAVTSLMLTLLTSRSEMRSVTGKVPVAMPQQQPERSAGQPYPMKKPAGQEAAQKAPAAPSGK